MPLISLRSSALPPRAAVERLGPGALACAFEHAVAVVVLGAPGPPPPPGRRRPRRRRLGLRGFRGRAPRLLPRAASAASACAPCAAASASAACGAAFGAWRPRAALASAGRGLGGQRPSRAAAAAAGAPWRCRGRGRRPRCRTAAAAPAPGRSPARCPTSRPQITSLDQHGHDEAEQGPHDPADAAAGKNALRMCYSLSIPLSFDRSISGSGRVGFCRF